MNELGHTDAAPLLAGHGLSVRRGRARVLHAVDVELRGGECLTVVGPNGSGKSTLLRALLGLLPLEAGDVYYHGKSLRTLSPAARARHAAYVPQILEQVPRSTVRDVIAGGRFCHLGATRAFSAAHAAATDRALADCDLTPLAEREFHTLSGGERQKTLLAAALAQDPRALLLDEPHAALDPGYQVELVNILRAWRAPDRAVLLVSHDLHLPIALGARVVALRAGVVAAAGAAHEILTPANLTRIYETPFEEATTRGGARVVLPDWWSRRGLSASI